MATNSGREIDIEFDDDDEDTLKDRFLTFKVKNEDYGIEIVRVKEIVGIQEITPVPEMPSYIKGVINLRGNVINVVDIRLRFNMEEKEYDERTCIIIIQVEDVEVGMIVDNVSEVCVIPEEDIKKNTNLSKNSKSTFIKGLGKLNDKIKMIIDVEKLLTEEELEGITLS